MTVEHLVGRRVVIVDDDLNQAAPLALLLRLDGIDATCEHVATAAVVRLAIDPPDAVIVDVRMPELSGPDLVARLWARHRNLPVVFLTCCEEDDPGIANAVATSRAAYLSKPVELGRLRDVLARLLASSQ